MTAEHEVAEVLAAHSTGGDPRTHESTCTCGWRGPFRLGDWAGALADKTAHIAEALAPLIAEREELAYERGHVEGYEKGLLAPESAWMRGNAERERLAAERVLREAQQALAGEDTIEWARSAGGSSVSLPWAIELLDDLIETVVENAGALAGAERSWLQVRQAARMLGVHENTIRNMCNDGRLAFDLGPSGFRRIPRSAIARLQEKVVTSE